MGEAHCVGHSGKAAAAAAATAAATAQRRRHRVQLAAAAGLLLLLLAASDLASQLPRLDSSGGRETIPGRVAALFRPREASAAARLAERRRKEQQMTAWRPPHDRRVAFVHKSADPITLRGLRAAQLAKQQVEAAGGWYVFVYSLYPSSLPEGTGLPASERQRMTLNALRDALGDESVVVIGREQVVAALGEGVLGAYKRLLTKQMRQKKWAWSTNDVVDITWHEQYGAALPSWAEQVWSVELDVAWTGNIVDALLMTVNTTNADWVAYETEPSTRRWFWHTCHNWLERGQEWKSYRHVARYSRRLLRAIAAEMRRGRVQCDELTAPSICMLSPEWCVVDAGWQPGHPAAGWDPRTGEDLYRWDALITPEQWDAVLRASPAGSSKLYHKIKW